MKRYLNYLLLASNFVIAIAIAILLGIFLKKNGDVNFSVDNKLYEAFASNLWIIIVAALAGIIIFCVYIYFLRKEIQAAYEPINPRLINGLLYSGIISFVNFVIPVVLALIGMYNKNREETITMYACALGISGLIGLIITGFTSYFNLRISWANVRREQLRSESLEENTAKIESDEDVSKHTSHKMTKDASKTEHKELTDELPPPVDQPTSGSF